MNQLTAIYLQHANDILTELLNDQKLTENKADLLLISEAFNTLNKRLNRLFEQRYSESINNICDLTLQQLHEARIVSQQYLVSRIKYEYLEQAAKAIQMGTFIDYAQTIYSKTSKGKTFKRDIENIIKACNRFYANFDCQLNKDEVIIVKNCDYIYQKMYEIIKSKLK